MLQSETNDVENNESSEEQTISQEPNNKSGEWFVATVLAWMFGITSFLILRDYFIFENGLAISGVGVIGGLFVTAWMMFDFPGVMPRFGMNGFIRLGMVVLFGVLIGEISGWIILRIQKKILVNE